MQLNETIRSELAAWGRHLPGFSERRLVDGLRFAQVIIEELCKHGISAADERSLRLLAMDSAWMLWLDDCIDDGTVDGGREIDWDALQGSAHDQPTTELACGFFLLRSRFEHEAPSGEAYQFWRATALDVFHSLREEQLLSRGERSWCYAEYLDNGEQSSVVAHLLATISLACGLNMPERMKQTHFRRLLQNLSRTLRLHNDLAHPEKERQEGNRANAVLLVEEFLGPNAWNFIAAEQKGYERLVLRDLALLGETDPFVLIIRTLLLSTKRLYQDEMQARR